MLAGQRAGDVRQRHPPPYPHQRKTKPGPGGTGNAAAARTTLHHLPCAPAPPRRPAISVPTSAFAAAGQRRTVVSAGGPRPGGRPPGNQSHATVAPLRRGVPRVAGPGKDGPTLAGFGQCLPPAGGPWRDSGRAVRLRLRRRAVRPARRRPGRCGKRTAPRPPADWKSFRPAIR